MIEATTVVGVFVFGVMAIVGWIVVVGVLNHQFTKLCDSEYQIAVRLAHSKVYRVAR